MKKIFLEKTIKLFLATMISYYSREFIIDSLKHFIRERKITYFDCINFIIWNNGRNNDLEATEFFKKFKKKKYETVSSQAIGKQRIYIKPELFEKIYKSFINLIYKRHRNFSRMKDYIVCACDGSIFDLPNVTLTREEFKIGDHTPYNKERIRARVSGMLDVNSNLLLVTKIVEKTVKETTLAMEHLNDLKNRIDIEKFIAIYDRAYTSIELMMFTKQLNSKFVIRLKKNTFKNQRRLIKGNDGVITINLTNAIDNRFDNEELKEYARNMGRLKVRIVNIKLANGTIETLATNLDSDEFSVEDLKELYAQRWSIETGFKKLKSQVQIENFSGYRRIIIEQDFYAKIFIYNLATAIQWDSNLKLSVKHRDPLIEYINKACFSTIVGNMFIYFEDLLSNKEEIISKALSFLIEQGRRLYYQKNLLKLKISLLIKNIGDIHLQAIWGDDWEDKKEKRIAEDPTNKHPGNPKPTH